MSIRRATLPEIVQRCDHLAQQGKRLRPGQSPIAALDADGTLWGPDVAELLWRRLISQRALHRRAAAPIARALRDCGAEPKRDPYVDYEQLCVLHRAGLVPQETMVRAMLAGLAGLREETLYLSCVEVVSEAGELNSLDGGGTRRMIDELRELGYRVIVVSGSPRWAVEVAVRPLGIPPEDVLAGQVAVVDGALTDGIIEPLPWGKGKVQSILRRFGVVPRISMGNGLGDLPMLEATSHLRILVDPTDELKTACEEIKGATWSVSLLAPRATSHRHAAVARAAGQPAPTARRRPNSQT